MSEEDVINNDASDQSDTDTGNDETKQTTGSEEGAELETGAVEESQEDGDGEGEDTTVLSPREKAMQHVINESEKDRGIERDEDADDSDDGSDDDEDADPDADDEDGDGDDELDTAGEQDGDDAGDDQDGDGDDSQDEESILKSLGYYRNGAGELVTKLMVNGVEREVSAEALKTYSQKDLSGDLKYNEAATLRQEAQELFDRAQALNDETRQSELNRTTQSSEQDAEEIRSKAENIVNKLIQGEEESATEELVSLLSRPTLTTDTGEIASQAATAVMNELDRQDSERKVEAWKDSQDRGNQRFKEEFPQVYDDDNLFEMAKSKTRKMVQAHQAGDPDFINMAPEQMIVQAAKEVQDWANENMKGKSKEKTTVSREVDKSKLKVVPQSKSAKKPANGKKVVDHSPGAVVERMRRNRPGIQHN